jgi:acyl-coenzyme A synthetase/AMP-(fatty) acid ligase/3-hydroxymyristoyl/3-hydroxydecanoyl-(acyl carrier protein) dehydratase
MSCEFARFSGANDDDFVVARRGNGFVTERELRARIRGWTRALQRCPQAAIALFEPDGVEFSAALVGAWYAGKEVYLAGDVQPATCAALRDHSVAFVGAFPAELSPITTPDDDDATAQFPPLDGDAVTVVVFTSGSSGDPKPLRKRLTQLLCEVGTLEGQFGEQLAGCEVLSTVSHQHIYGFLFKILWPLVMRRTFVAESVTYAEDLYRRLAQRRTALVAGPAHLKRLPPSIVWDRVRSQVGAVFSSGGPLPRDAVDAVDAALGTTPIEVYGSSETGGIAWRQRRPVDGDEWRAFPGVEIRAHDDGLAVRSRNLPDDGWHVVPDQVTVLADGRFLLGGRTDRIVKIEGKRVSLGRIEQSLTDSALVDAARAILLPMRRDEIAVAAVLSDTGWVALRAGSAALRARLDAAVAEGTEVIARPRRWRWVSALPVNGVGKTAEADLRALFAPRDERLPLVHVLQRAPDRVQAELYVAPHLACFDGHFTNLPVLPGVAQVDWAVFFAREYFGVTGAFLNLEAVKFHRLFQPGPLLHVELNWRAATSQLLFRYTSDDGVHSSGRIAFAPAA